MSIREEHLTHIYDKGLPTEQIALEDINFTVEDGELLGVIGHTGSGKSTLIQHFNALIQPTSGTVSYNGEDVWAEKYDRRKLRSEVGLVFQYPEHQLFESDVLSDVCFGPMNQGMTREQYESLPLAELKGIAKTRGMKGTSTLKKSDLITRMLEKDEEVSRQEQIAQTEKFQKERQERYEQRQEQREQRERAERTERTERTERPTRYERTERSDRYDRNERYERTERTYDRPDRNERCEQRTYERPAYDRSAAPQPQTTVQPQQEQPTNLDSGQVANGILEVLADGYGFIRSDNYLPGENDIYINPALIRRYNLKTGDILCGNIKVRAQTEKFAALLYLKTVNGLRPEEAARRRNFEDLTPIFPNQIGRASCRERV